MKALFGPFGRFTLVAASVLALAPMLASGGSASQTSRPVSHGYAALTQDGSGDVAISDLRATMQADLRNPTTSDRQLYYRFEWLDQDGLAVWDDEPWKPMIVYGQSKRTISVSSPTFKATRFRLVVQNPN